MIGTSTRSHVLKNVFILILHQMQFVLSCSNILFKRRTYSKSSQYMCITVIEYFLLRENGSSFVGRFTMTHGVVDVGTQKIYFFLHKKKLLPSRQTLFIQQETKKRRKKISRVTKYLTHLARQLTAVVNCTVLLARQKFVSSAHRALGSRSTNDRTLLLRVIIVTITGIW